MGFQHADITVSQTMSTVIPYSATSQPSCRIPWCAEWASQGTVRQQYIVMASSEQGVGSNLLVYFLG